MSDIKYTKDNRKVRMVGKINQNQYVVQEIFVNEDGEFPAGENFVVDHLLDKPAETWKDRRVRQREEQLERIENELSSKRNNLLRAQEKAKLRADALFAFARNSDDRQLQRLHKFLAGDIQYFFIKDRWSPKIVTWSDQDLYCHRDRLGSHEEAPVEAIKLISLIGNSKGDLSYNIDRYSDGSERGGHQIVPCESYEEAFEEAQSFFDEMVEDFLSDNSQCNLNLEPWEIVGVKVPEAVYKKKERMEEKRRSERIQKLREELAELTGGQHGKN